MKDFPAAHSMDTEWFAVDENGRVGRFESDEDGAVPVDAATGFGPEDGTLDVDVIDATRLGWVTVAWCSYTRSRVPLPSPTFRALSQALAPLGVEPGAGDLFPVRRLSAAASPSVTP